MTSIDSISPAKYWRETQSWPLYINQTGTVIAATLIQFGLPELSQNAPYWLVLVKLEQNINKISQKLFIGADGNSYVLGDKVKCVLRRFSSPGNGLIHYGVKVIPV